MTRKTVALAAVVASLASAGAAQAAVWQPPARVICPAVRLQMQVKQMNMQAKLPGSTVRVVACQGNDPTRITVRIQVVPAYVTIAHFVAYVDVNERLIVRLVGSERYPS